MNKMIEFFDEYVKYVSQLCKKQEDYTKEKVAKHNKAVKNLLILKKQIKADKIIANEVYDLLLCYDDTNVQQSAATDCLSLNIHIDKSLQILKNVSKNGDTMSSMSAKRTLLIWEGRLNPNSPFQDSTD